MSIRISLFCLPLFSRFSECTDTAKWALCLQARLFLTLASSEETDSCLPPKPWRRTTSISTPTHFSCSTGQRKRPCGAESLTWKRRSIAPPRRSCTAFWLCSVSFRASSFLQWWSCNSSRWRGQQEEETTASPASCLHAQMRSSPSSSLSSVPLLLPWPSYTRSMTSHACAERLPGIDPWQIASMVSWKVSRQVQSTSTQLKLYQETLPYMTLSPIVGWILFFSWFVSQYWWLSAAVPYCAGNVTAIATNSFDK